MNCGSTAMHVIRKQRPSHPSGSCLALQVQIRCSKVTARSKSCELCFLKIFYLFLEKGEEREKEKERNINVWLPVICPSIGDLALNPGMCPNWELNWQHFGLQAGTQSTEPHQPGFYFGFSLGRCCPSQAHLTRSNN